MNATSTAFPIPGIQLTRFQAQIWRWLTRHHDPRRGICQATKTIAAKFGVKVRYVQVTLRRFIELGVLERVFDYGLRTRRRLLLVTPAETNSFGALQCAHSAHSSAPTNDTPLEPPLYVSGDGLEKGIGGGDIPVSSCDPEPAAEPSPPPPLVSISPPPESEPEPEPSKAPEKATKEQVEALVSLAKEVLPAQPRQWVTGLARRWSLRWVRAALARAKAKGQVKTGYVIRTLEGFAAEGGPPPELADPGKAEIDRAARRAELIRQCEEEMARNPIRWCP